MYGNNKRIIIVILLLIFFSFKVKGQNDSILTYKNMLRGSKVELEANYLNEYFTNSWELIFISKRKFLFIRNYYKAPYYRVITHTSDSTADVINSTIILNAKVIRESNTIKEFVIYEYNDFEKFKYQLIKMQNDLLVVELYYIDQKGRVKNTHYKLLYKKIK